MTDWDDQYSATADLYDHVTAYADRPDVAFWVDAAVASGGPVLELGCGTGRVLVPTARAGIEITGLDLSPRMLAMCERRLQAESEAVLRRVRLVHGDMRGFALDRTFALVTIPFRPFQHLLSVDDQLRCLSCVRRHLAPGARLVFDLFNPTLEVLATLEPGREVRAEDLPFTTPDGRHVVRRHRTKRHDRAGQVHDIEMIYDITHPDGRTEQLSSDLSMRYFFRFEVEHLLARSRFSIEQLYAGYDRAPFGSRYPGELIFIARVS